MPRLEILLDYGTLFCNCGEQFRLRNPEQESDYISGVKIEDGIKHISAQTKTLDELLKVLPNPESFQVGLKNCETMVSTVRNVGSPDKAVDVVKEILTRVYSLPKEYLPLQVNVFSPRDSNQYDSKIENWLNSLGKTMRPIKGDSIHPILYYLMMSVSSGARYGRVKDLPRR